MCDLRTSSAVLRGLTLAAAFLSAGCYHQVNGLVDPPDSSLVSRNTARNGQTHYNLPSNPIVPNATLKLTPSYGVRLENLLIGAAVYYFVDPLAPNWEGELKRVTDDTFSIAMRSKRFRSTGGDGEAGRVFKRNAEMIVREGGFAGYDLLAYSEGIESEVIGAYRYAEGTIRVTRKPS